MCPVGSWLFLMTCLYILIENSDEGVAVWSCLFVVETDGVSQLVYDHTFLKHIYNLKRNIWYLDLYKNIAAPKPLKR